MKRPAWLVSVLFALGVCTVSSGAAAEYLTATTDPEGNWGYVGAEVTQWTPASGPAASHIADAFLAHGGSMWMGLGYDDGGFWSAEGYAADACDTCDGLNLVHTDKSGKRQSFVIVANEDHGDKSAPEFRKAIKSRIFALAAKHWPVSEMRHDYKLKLPAVDGEGKVEKFTGWLAQVSNDMDLLLRYAPQRLSYMCWADQTWTGYALAQSSRRPSK